MKKIIIFLFCLMTIPCAIAQDSELNKLMDIVTSLRKGGENAYKASIKKLAVDKAWTPMDELVFNHDVECKASERVPGFRLNSILTKAENEQRRQVTTGNHLNGADSRYHYSLFEKTLKAGKSATYKLPERYGDQVFIIIPYSGKISASASSGNNRFSSSVTGNGIIKLTGKAVKGLPVNITVTNNGTENISYVIINYNSRQ